MKWGRSSYEHLGSMENPLRFAKEILGFQPDEPQARILREALQFKQIMLNCSRPWGKSTVVAVLALYWLLMNRGATVLVVGPVQKQAGETVGKVRFFLKKLGIRTRGDRANPGAAVLPNGSRIIALPAVEASVRGFSAVGLLIIEEASGVPDEACLALLPCLSVSDGDLIVLSTPKGKRGFFYREMTEERPDVLRHTGPVTECGRVSERVLVVEKSRGDEYFRQEYLCEFVEDGKYLFNEGLVKKMGNPKEQGWRIL